MTRQTDILPHARSADEETSENQGLEPGWDDVAQASWESFPASDSPGWINLSHRDRPIAKPAPS